MMHTLKRSLAAAALVSAGAAHADGHAALMGYALVGDGKTLVTMNNLSEPGEVAQVALSSRVDAIAYRPVTSELLGFSRDGAIYAINTVTGQMTDLDASFAGDARIGTETVAFDFNNALDAVRAVGADGANLVYFPSNFGDERANSVRRFTDTFYITGDANYGTAPGIYANAYTNAIAGKKAETTFQYALDATTDALVSLANNTGELVTIGDVKIDGASVDLAASGGFDIVSPYEGTDSAYAILEIDGADTSGLYTIDLVTAEATLLADLGLTGVSGFAVSMGGQ